MSLREAGLTVKAQPLQVRGASLSVLLQVRFSILLIDGLLGTYRVFLCLFACFVTHNWCLFAAFVLLSVTATVNPSAGGCCILVLTFLWSLFSLCFLVFRIKLKGWF